MGLAELVEKVTDSYERKARLYPALLALFPLIAMLAILYSPAGSVLTNIVMLTASCGGLYLMTSICREMGKRLEPGLYKRWGGKPTTVLLRHRDSTIDGVTKHRYHNFLASKIGEPFPDQEQEANNPDGADDVYQSAVRWLLNQTRDTQKFALLFKENITYGFLRNALGVKPIGLVISFCSAVWILFSNGVVTTPAKFYLDINALVALPDTAIISLSASAIMLAVWLLFFTQASARRAAFTYAETLLRACDEL